MVLAQTTDVPPCGPPEEAGWLCEAVESVTGKPGLARAADVLIARPVTVVLILVVAWLVIRLLHRAIRRFVRRLQAEGPGAPRRLWLTEGDAAPSPSTRLLQRGEAIGTLLRSVTSVVVWSVAALMALAELGLNLAPLLTGAGVVGVALGFGSQSLVKDFIAGIFMLVEDQYGVGDVIDTGEAEGTVESVSLRTTRLRGVDGTMWHVPNGEIRRVGNKSQEWSRAILDVPVPYDSDLGEVSTLLQTVADGLAREPAWAGRITAAPEVWGVERFDADSVAVRLVLTTVPLEQWAVSRELRRRIKDAFDEKGLEIPFPQRTVWLRHDDHEAIGDRGRP